MEKAVTHYNDNSVNDDLSTEEIADIKEYYSNNEKSKKFSTVEELLQDLKNWLNELANIYKEFI